MSYNDEAQAGGKIDFWKILLGIVIIMVLVILGLEIIKFFGNDNSDATTNDSWWHMGYQECIENKVNLTDNELMILNEYRIRVAEHQCTEYNVQCRNEGVK